MLEIPPFCDGVIRNTILTDIIFTTGQGFIGGRSIGISIVMTLVSAQHPMPPGNNAYATMLGSRDALILLFLFTCVPLISSISIFY